MYVCLQVSVTAEQHCRLLTWSSPRLRQYLTCDSHLLLVFDLIIGNDIASKLYSAKCRPRHTAATSSVSVPATRSLPLPLDVGDNHRLVHGVRNHPERPEKLPLKSCLPSFFGESFNVISQRLYNTVLCLLCYFVIFGSTVKLLLHMTITIVHCLCVEIF